MFIRRTLIFTLLCCATLSFAHVTSGATTGKSPAADFTLKSNSGKNIKLSELRGQVVMINFWASWCGPCRQEMPLLDQLYKKYQPMGFTLLGVNVEDNPNEATKWLKGKEVGFPILFDSESKVSELYNVSAMPTTLIIDRDGNMRYYHRGYVSDTEDEYQQQIRELLKE